MAVTMVLDVVVDMGVLVVVVAVTSGGKGEILFIVVFSYLIVLTPRPCPPCPTLTQQQRWLLS